MSGKELRTDEVARSVSEVRYVALVKRRPRHKLRDRVTLRRDDGVHEARADLEDMLVSTRLLLPRTNIDTHQVRSIAIQAKAAFILSQATSRALPRGHRLHQHPQADCSAPETAPHEHLSCAHCVALSISGSPARRSPMRGLGSEMDMIRKAPRRGHCRSFLWTRPLSKLLVDTATAKPGDGDPSVHNIDEASLHGSISSNGGDQDQVCASIRCVPFSHPPSLRWSWTHPEPDQQTQPAHVPPKPSTSPGSAPAPYNFNNILTGTLDKPMYAAMEGYNELIFAYVWTT
ncbi:hypothetical protein FIBSPDRAFT_962805 [Athelia psychrophila]|uniref:Uncharacterized protein n=1 Tax=Athelia psychrophila TaxID=1759441 RepID=A0A165ZQI8_9AGAM|nr:hypothetical protein FIBSPDRAFT_962805 [Fibularhizoctonia sp. CBS 109695]